MQKRINKMADIFQKEALNVLYVQMRQGGRIAGEYSRLSRKARMNMYSISKSVVSVGAGIAIAEGLIHMDDRVSDFFAENVEGELPQSLTHTEVRHLLTMTSGLENPLFFADSPERYYVKDWIDYFLHAEFSYEPGAHFLYSNFNTYMLSCMIEKRAGQNLLEYLRYRLFEPIGVGNPDWTLCPMGHVHAANGLFFNIDELGNFGELLLHYGTFKGRQIVPETYLREASVDQVKGRAAKTDDRAFCGYGYQFWMTPLENTFLCSGNYGQYCLVMPDKDAVVSVISFEDNHGRIKDILLQSCAAL